MKTELKRELTLQDLAPYLPYELCLRDNFIKNGKIREMTSLGISKDGKLYFTEKDTVFKHSLEHNQPLLIPIASLTQDQLKKILKHLFQGEQFDIDFNHISNDKGFISFFDRKTNQFYVVIKPGRDGLPVLNMSNTYKDYEVLFEMNVDMNKLIDAGLALNKNEYPNI